MTYQGTGDFTGASGKKYHGEIGDGGADISGTEGLTTVTFIETGILNWGTVPINGKIYKSINRGGRDGAIIESLITKYIFIMNAGESVHGESGIIPPEPTPEPKDINVSWLILGIALIIGGFLIYLKMKGVF